MRALLSIASIIVLNILFATGAAEGYQTDEIGTYYMS